MRLRFALGIALIGAAILFILQNVGAIEIRFLVWSATLPRSLLLLVVLLIGVLIGWLWHGLSLRRMRKRGDARADGRR